MKYECLYDELKDPLTLKEHTHNANKHSQEQIDRLVKILHYQGFRYPVKVSKQSGMITAGHGRVMAAKKIGCQVPVNFQDYASFEMEISDVHADNAIASWAEMDLGIVNNQMGEFGPDFDLELLGIKDFKLDLLPELNLESSEKKQITEAEETMLNIAWSQWCKESVDLLKYLEQKKIFFQSLTPAYLKISFLNSLLFDKKFPRSATTTRQYHRMLCSGDGDNGSILDLLKKASDNNSLSPRLRFSMQEKPSMEKLMTVSGIAMSGYKAPLDFPAELARDLMNEFASEGAVLDPCHGWGGRLIGFMLSKANIYHGIDASDLTNAALNEIKGDLIHYVSGKDIELHCSDFESFDAKKDFYNLSMTSPPYFDREHYIGGNQAHEVYKNYDDFIAGFYTKLIQKSYDSLKQDGHLVLQVGNQKYDLDKKAIQISLQCGFNYVEKRSTNMTALGSTSEDESNEVILIFKKQ